MVVLEPLNKLLQAKWDLLLPKFFFNFLCYIVYTAIFTAVAYHQPSLDKARLGGGTCWGKLSRAILEEGIGDRTSSFILKRVTQLFACCWGK